MKRKGEEVVRNKRVMFLKGKRVELRTHVLKDVDTWYRWFNDTEVTRGMFKGLFPNTKEKQLDFFENMYKSNENLQLAIVDSKSGRLIGTIGLHQIDLFHGTADLRIVIGEKEFWRQGLGQEAAFLMLEHGFDKLCLHKVTSGMYSTNDGSRRLFESLGFKREGVLRQQIAWEGKHIDLYKYGLLAEEWRRQQKGKKDK